MLLYITSMDAEKKIQTCSTCGDAFIAGMINGKQLKIAVHVGMRKTNERHHQKHKKANRHQMMNNHSLYHLLMKNRIITIQTCRYVSLIS